MLACRPLVSCSTRTKLQRSDALIAFGPVRMRLDATFGFAAFSKALELA